jgi:purine-binding chemotaxis protein CheW
MKTLKEMRRENAVAADLHTEKYLTFFIDGQLFTIPTSEVVEIIRMQPITYIPNTVAYVKGVINLRGKVVPVIDMRLRFQKEEVPYDTRTSIVIVEKKDMTVGLIVDSVRDVLDVSSAQISDSPKFFGRNAIGKNAVSKNFVCGMVTLSENETAMLLDIAKVLTHHSRDSVKAAEKTDSAADASAQEKAQGN